MKIHEIMSAHARCIGPDNTLVEAAGLMRQLDVGALPVCEADRLAGMVTDRDIVLRGVAEGRDPHDAPVRDVMSPGIVYVFADQDVEEVARLMEDRQIRRLPVLNRQKRLVGIVSLGDVATSSNPVFSGRALRDISQPPNPTARQRRLKQASEPAGKPQWLGDGTSGDADSKPRRRDRARPEAAPTRGASRSRAKPAPQRRAKSTASRKPRSSSPPNRRTSRTTTRGRTTKARS